MMGFLYVLGDFLRTSLRQAGYLVGWAAAVGAVLASATVLVLVPLGASPTVASQHLVVLTLDPLLSEAEINRLAWQIAGWPEAVRVNFRFAGETDPEPLAERALVVEAKPEGRELLLSRLAKLAGVRKVTTLERRAEQPLLPSGTRLIALAALAVGLALALFLGQHGTRRALALWEKPREILRISGLSPLYWQGPPIALGLAVGMVGAGLFLLAWHVGLRLAPQESGWREVLRGAPWLPGVSVPAGGLLGCLGSLLRVHS